MHPDVLKLNKRTPLKCLTKCLITNEIRIKHKTEPKKYIQMKK